MVFGTAACAGAAIPNPTSSPIARVDVQVIANNFWRNLLASAELRRLVANGVTVCILIGGQCRIDDGGVRARSDERVRPTRLQPAFCPAGQRPRLITCG